MNLAIWLLSLGAVLAELVAVYVGLAAHGNEQHWFRAPADSTPEQAGHRDHTPDLHIPERATR